MPINPAETPIAQPLLYSEAMKRINTGARPEPLGKDYARGVKEPAIRVEISEKAQLAQAAITDRLSALNDTVADNQSRPELDQPPRQVDTQPQRQVFVLESGALSSDAETAYRSVQQATY